jgi:mannose-6-phosphate isomerase-like protein (cupin superfamily)
MAGAQSRAFDSPDETRTFANGKFDVIRLGDNNVARFTFEPGWKWSESVKPIAGTDLCQKHHIGYVVQGQLRVVTKDGDEVEVGPGDAYEIMPGHDAWVVGNQTWIGLEFESKTAAEYAKK